MILSSPAPRKLGRRVPPRAGRPGHGEPGHLTAAEAGRIAAESGVRLLVLTHFSQRYAADGAQRLAAEAEAAFGGAVILARDLDRIPVPRRVSSARGGGSPSAARSAE